MIGLQVDGKPLLRAYSMAQRQLRGAPRILQHQGAERAAHLAAAASPARRPDPGRPQADRHAGAGQPAAGQARCTCSGPAPAWRHSRASSATRTSTTASSKIVLVHGVPATSTNSATARNWSPSLPEHEFLGELVREQAALLPDGDARAVPQPRPHHASARDQQADRRPRPAAARAGERPGDAVRQPGLPRRHGAACSSARGFAKAARTSRAST